MNRMFFLMVLILGIMMMVSVGYAQTTTLDNLKAAYQSELDKQTLYIACAAKADEEGYLGVGSLYRALAASEGVQAKNHKEVILAMSGSVDAVTSPVTIGTTAENLKTTLENEIKNRDKMYSEYLSQARAERIKPALRTFNFAKNSEAEHAKLIQEVLDNLDDWKQGPREFFICGVCGYTTVALDFDKCPVCYSPLEDYFKVE